LDYVSDILSLQQNYELSKRENLQLTNVNDLIETALKIQLNNLEAGGVSVSKDLDVDLPELLIDRNRFIQVLINVIKNACEAIDAVEETDAQKRINIKTSSNQDYITIEISDTGIGIAPDQIQELFELGISKKGSTGLGLYFSKMFMEKSNGRLTIDSPGIGQGTTLKLILNR
jgi:hypothetical protein